MTAGLAGGNDTHSKNAFIVKGVKTDTFFGQLLTKLMVEL